MNSSILPWENSSVGNLTSDEVPLRLQISASVLISFAVILLTLLLLGVLGNVAAIVSILVPNLSERISHGRTAYGRRDLTTTNAYIVNLNAADLLFLIFCAPFQGTVYILNHWPYGLFMCKVAHFCQFCTAYASVWILTMMSIDRYAAIAHPLRSVKWRRSRRVAKVSIGIWLAAGFLSSPWLFLYVTTDVRRSTGAEVTACYDDWPYDLFEYRKWLLLAATFIGFIIPALTIFSMAVLVARSIHSTFTDSLLNESTKSSVSARATMAHSKTSGLDSSYSVSLLPRQHHGHPCGSNSAAGNILRKRRRVCWLVFALAFIFFIFQGPQNASLLWMNFDSSAIHWIQRSHETFFILRLIAHMLTYVNAVLNPILYGLASGRIRQFFMGGKTPDKNHVKFVMATFPNGGSGVTTRRWNRPMKTVVSNDGSERKWMVMSHAGGTCKLDENGAAKNRSHQRRDMRRMMVKDMTERHRRSDAETLM